MSAVVSEQDRRERERLHAAWLADSVVEAFRAAAVTFAEEQGLSFDVFGMNELFKFGHDWFRAHGPLPDSGIKTG